MLTLIKKIEKGAGYFFSSKKNKVYLEKCKPVILGYLEQLAG